MCVFILILSERMLAWIYEGVYLRRPLRLCHWLAWEHAKCFVLLQYVLYDTHSSSSEKVLQSLQGERYTVVNIIKKIHSAFIKQVIHACICETLYVNRVDSQGVLILLHMASICMRKQIRKQITNMLCKDFAKPGEKVFRFTWNKMSFMNLT